MTTTMHDFATSGDEIAEIPVAISLDIIRLFSEGLYKSPHKAVEELVSNSYDAGASRVHVLLPDPEDRGTPDSPLWVIDDGHGMSVDGFHQLWKVADSAKADAPPANGRLPIGQFGIGKLAAYVLAWHLIHISRVGGRYLLTVMDFNKVKGRQADDPKPASVSLRDVEEPTARQLLADIKARDAEAWKLLFGATEQDRSWTVAGLTEFRDLYQQLSTGTLRWVLSTGLPLKSDFSIHLDGQRVISSKEKLKEIKSVNIAEQLAGIGDVLGKASIYEKPLTGGKSAAMGRSHGFFIRVRERVINLEDELFGVTQPNHAAWARFALEVRAEGLRDHLLSSREGVRDSRPVREFREHLLIVFNQCRTAFAEWQRSQAEDLDIDVLVSDQPSSHILEPLRRAVHNAAEAGAASFYIGAPKDVDDGKVSEWLDGFDEDIEEKPFDDSSFARRGPHTASVLYDPTTRRVAINLDHPFIDKLTSGGKNRNPAKLFGVSEVLLEGGLQGQGVESGVVAEFLWERDRVLRLMAGEAPPTAVEAIRFLQVANQDKDALERATGAAFRVLGFEYEQKGGSKPGADGVLSARLGQHGGSADTHRDYKLVYDAKQTDQPSVPADKVDPASLEDFRVRESAAFGFFVAARYAGEAESQAKINRKIVPESDPKRHHRLTLITISHLERLIRLHLKHGLTLTDVWDMFEKCRTVGEVDEWIGDTNSRLSQQDIPLVVLLSVLERLKDDELAVPSVKAARERDASLKGFSPPHLTARLKAVQTIIGDRWLQVDESGDVVMHQNADQILSELEGQIGALESQDGDGEQEGG